MKTVLITGGTRGIGRQLCFEYAKLGYKVFSCYSSDDKSAAEFKRLANEQGFEIEVYRCDVAKEGDVAEMFTSIFKRCDGIDILVNNAGTSLVKQIQDTTIEKWNRVIDVNLTSAFLCSKQALTKMLNKKSGHIVNITSMWGLIGASCEVAYSASKAGLIGFTKALAKELAPSNIFVNAISCGMIDTDMNKCFSATEKGAFVCDLPISRLGNVEDIANAVLFLTEKSSYITGQVINVDGGYVI